MPKKKKVQNESKSNLFCERCHRVGHLLQDCYTLICDYCKKMGHAFVDCRSLQRDRKYIMDATRQIFQKNFTENVPYHESIENEASTSSESSSSIDAEMSTLSTIGTYREYLKSPHKDIIEISTTELKNRKAKMLVSVNSPISMIKIGKLKDNVTAAREVLTLEDSYGARIKTICLICLSIRVNNKTILHPCRVVSDDIYIETDGVLGSDFIVRSKFKSGEYIELAGVQIPFINNEFVRGVLRVDELVEVSSTDSDTETLTGSS